MCTDYDEDYEQGPVEAAPQAPRGRVAATGQFMGLMDVGGYRRGGLPRPPAFRESTADAGQFSCFRVNFRVRDVRIASGLRFSIL